MNTAYVNINNAIANILVQPGNLDLIQKGEEVWTVFDLWWHGQMISYGDDFNAS